MATRSSSCCVALNSMRFIERLQSGVAARSDRVTGRTTRGSAPRPYCVFTSTLERERWRGELPERTRYGRRGPRAAWAHANTASNNGVARGARRALGDSSLRSGAPFDARAGPGKAAPRVAARSPMHARPPHGVSRQFFDVAESPASRGTHRALAVGFAIGSPVRSTSRATAEAHLMNSFLPKFRYRRHRPDRTRLWATSLPRWMSCVQLVATRFRASNRPLDTAKQVK